MIGLIKSKMSKNLAGEDTGLLRTERGTWEKNLRGRILTSETWGKSDILCGRKVTIHVAECRLI